MFVSWPRPLVDSSVDRDLVRRLRAGDERAFGEFFDDYFPRLYRFALRRVADETLAEDVVQATLTQALRRIDTWRGEAALFTWLCTICRREATAQAERASRRVVVPFEDRDPDVRAALDALAHDVADPEALASQADVGRLVQLVLDSLPPRYGRVLEWKYLDELSMQEIAARLQATPKAIESLLSRARAAFREGFVTVQQTRERQS